MVTSNPAAAGAPQSPLAPLRHPVFRMLWLTWLAANICMWMNDVAAAWKMTTLTTSPMMVALVQSASSLPVFLLGIPSGALADIIDRRSYFIATQFWVALVAAVLCLTSFTGTLTAPLLLLLTCAYGIGLAMRWPVFAALVPELVPRDELSLALGLNAIAMNASRVFGPIIAGAVIAAFGSAWVFVLNALLSITNALILLRWRRERNVSALPSQRFLGAIRVGIQHCRQSPPMLAAMLRISTFFVFANALLALLPLEARRLPGGGAGTFTVLLATMGSGAIIAAMLLPRLRHAMTRDQLVSGGTLLQAAGMMTVAFAPNLWVATPAMLVTGMAWITVANSITVAAQMALPNWVKARGMAIYQTAMMGASALGAALWGQVASLSSVQVSMALASVGAMIALLATRRLTVGGRAEEELTPARVWQEPQVVIPMEHHHGPVLVTVEYLIDPARAAEFVALMRESRRLWLQNGVLEWNLFRDTAHTGRYIEYFIDESWVEYLRRQEHFTAAGETLRQRKFAFHIGDQPPAVSRYIAEPITRRW